MVLEEDIIHVYEIRVPRLMPEGMEHLAENATVVWIKSDQDLVLPDEVLVELELVQGKIEWVVGSAGRLTVHKHTGSVVVQGDLLGEVVAEGDHADCLLCQKDLHEDL